MISVLTNPISKVKGFYLNHKRQINAIIVLAVLVLMLIVLPAQAGLKDDMRKDIRDTIEEIQTSGVDQSMINILTKSPNDYPVVFSTIKNIYNGTIKPFAFSLLVLYLVIGIVQGTTNFENYNYQQFLKPFIVVVIGVVAIDNGEAILNGLFNIGSSIAASISSVAGSLKPNKEAVDKVANQLGINDKGVIALLIVKIELLIPKIFMFIVSVVSKVLAVSVMFEILIKWLFFPIGISDIGYKGFEGNGFRYIKSFAASCLQGGVMLAIALIYSRLQADSTFASQFSGDGSWGLINQGNCRSVRKVSIND